MTRPLWPAGLALWPLVSSVTVSILPPEPGLFSERPMAWALVVGGCCAIPLWVFDFVRERRVWLGALIAWGAVFCLMVAATAASPTDPDMDQQIGWAVLLPGLIALPTIGLSLWVKAMSVAGESWARRRRRWRVEVDRSKMVLVRKKRG